MISLQLQLHNHSGSFLNNHKVKKDKAKEQVPLLAKKVANVHLFILREIHFHIRICKSQLTNINIFSRVAYINEPYIYSFVRSIKIMFLPLKMYNCITFIKCFDIL